MAPGLGTRKLTLTIDGTDVTPQVSRAIISTGESDADFTSFADAAAGGAREYRLLLTFVQDPTTDSLWDQVWSHAGEDIVAVVRPAGTGTGKPVFTGTVTITEPDGDLLGGEADSSPSARFVTEVEWVFTAKPVKTTSV